MNIKTLFLLLIFSFILTSCSVHTISLAIKDPQKDYFVKVFKELEVTRCPKAKPNPPEMVSCETKKIITTGSGLYIRLSKTKTAVLTAGHVCKTDSIADEDETYKYEWSDVVRLLDKDMLLHQGHVILSKSGLKGAPDLCALYSPTLEDRFKKKPNIVISKRKPKIGEEIYYIGAPRGIYHPPTALMVKGMFDGNIDKVSALATIAAAPGSSGSVILSMDNKIYGVLFAVHNEFHVASIITSYEETKSFLKETLLLLK